jgi:thiol-disulfide isomerase/thioredoxin
MANQPSTKPKLLWLWVGLGAVVVLAAGFAILSSGEDEELTVGSTVAPSEDAGATEGTGGATSGESGEFSGDTAAAGGGSGEVAETWPVTLTGAPLPEKPDGDDPALGTAAPGLSGFTFDGTPVAVDPSKGPVMLVFLAHWCPHCNDEVPELNEWRDSGDVPEGLQVIAVTTAVRADAPHYPPSSWISEEMGWTWPVLADSPTNEAAIAFGVSGFPFSVILDTDGTVLGRSSGQLGLAGIEAFVAESLARAA